ncbi:MAG: DNA alkylation repair protein [Oscillospiraceae bacterium]|nr:DNA alkylation repair protein [Oscillospiraceae bacterium]
MPTQIQSQLFRLQDPQYRAFQCKLLPTVPPETVIGVRTPALRAYAKELRETETAADFLRDLPHAYFDENQLHAFLLCELRDYTRCIAEVERFLPYVDNWATCDQLSPRAFRRHRPELLERVRVWLGSEAPYTVRFGLGMLMEHYLDDAFQTEYPELVARLRAEDYYVKMMIAWYFATALAKQYAAALPFLEQGRLDVWTHNKAIQKAVESRRIPPERKEYLKTLKRKPTGEA